MIEPGLHWWDTLHIERHIERHTQYIYTYIYILTRNGDGGEADSY